MSIASSSLHEQSRKCKASLEAGEHTLLLTGSSFPQTNSFGSINLPVSDDPPPPYNTHVAGNYEASKTLSGKPTRTMLVLRCLKLSLFFAVPFLIAFTIINLVIIIPKIEDYVNRSIDVRVQEVDFAGIGKGFKSVNLESQVLTTLDYRKLNNTYLTSLFKMNGALFKTVDITLDNINIHLLDEADEKTSNANDAIINLGVLNIPRFKMNITQGTPSLLRLPITLKPNSRELYKFLQKLLSKMQAGETSIVVRVFLNTKMKLNLGIFPIWHEFKINYDNKYDLLDQVSILTSLLSKIFFQDTPLDSESQQEKDINLSQIFTQAVTLSEQVLNKISNLPIKPLLLSI